MYSELAKDYENVHSRYSCVGRLDSRELDIGQLTKKKKQSWSTERTGRRWKFDRHHCLPENSTVYGLNHTEYDFSSKLNTAELYLIQFTGPLFQRRAGVSKKFLYDVCTCSVVTKYGVLSFTLQLVSHLGQHHPSPLYPLCVSSQCYWVHSHSLVLFSYIKTLF